MLGTRFGTLLVWLGRLHCQGNTRPYDFRAFQRSRGLRLWVSTNPRPFLSLQAQVFRSPYFVKLRIQFGPTRLGLIVVPLITTLMLCPLLLEEVPA